MGGGGGRGGGASARSSPLGGRKKKKERSAEVFAERVKDASTATTSSFSIPKTGASLPESLCPSKKRNQVGWRMELGEMAMVQRSLLPLNLSHGAR